MNPSAGVVSRIFAGRAGVAWHETLSPETAAPMATACGNF
jgi:hypothetical protein